MAIYQKAKNRNPSDPLTWANEGSVSSTECTGLVPAAIQTPEEADHYDQLYAIHHQKTAWDAERKEKNKQR